jgi:hypothetical protein
MFRLLNRGRNERFHVRIAANHAIERDNVRWRQRTGHFNEIVMVVAYTLALPTPDCLIPRGFKVSGRCLHDHRAGEPGRKKLMRYYAYTAADIEERFALDAQRANGSQQQSSRSARTILAVAAQFSLCKSRTEETFGIDAMIATGHWFAPSDPVPFVAASHPRQ